MSIVHVGVKKYEPGKNNLTIYLTNNYKAYFQSNERDIFHIIFESPQGLKIPNTWQIAPGLQSIPEEGFFRLNLPGFSANNFQVHDNAQHLLIEGKTLQVLVNKQEFHLAWQYKKNGKWITFAQDRPSQAYHFHQSHADNIRHYMERRKDDEYFGLGEKSGHLKRNGRRFRFLNIDAMGYDAESTDPLYKHIPFILTRNRSLGIYSGFFYDNLSESVLDMGQEMDNYHGHYRYYTAKSGDLDFYVFAGEEIRQLTQTMSWLTGKTMMPPKWSLYYSGSTMKYTDADNAQEQLYQFLEDCKKHDISCRSFQLSSGYTTIGNNIRCVFNWNTKKFPDFKKLAKDFMDNNIQFCANIKPAMLEQHPMYAQMKEKAIFVKEAESEEPELFQFWDGLGAAIDFTNPAASQWWQSQVKEKLLEYGITSTWNDNNEYEIWDESARCHGFGEKICIGEIRPLMALLMIRASYQAQIDFDSKRRPYLISRSGPAGLQRYAQTWSGDNYTSWKTLKFNNYMGLSLSLCGVYNFGHDIGGFSGPAPEPELLVRWMQHGVFWPRYTVHSWNDDGSVNVPWMYQDYLSYTKQALALRGKLIPYIYHLLYRAHTEYEAILKPLFYDFQDDENCDSEDDNFLMGNILAAPVIEKGAKTKRIYFPRGSYWYNCEGTKIYEGGTSIELDVNLESILYFVREGTVLGLNTAADGFGLCPEERTFEIYPLQQGEFSQIFFEDDGETFAFEQEGFLKYHFNVISDSKQIKVNISCSGRWQPEYDQIIVQVPPLDGREFICNGEKIKANKSQIKLTEITKN